MYWQTQYNGQQVQVTTATLTISTQGFPSDYTSGLSVDGKAVGSIAGGGTAKFQIKGDDVHTFQVDSYVSGQTGERFYTKSNSWTSEKGKEVSVTSYTDYFSPYYNVYGYDWYYYYPYYAPTTQTVTQPFDQSYTFAYQPQYQLTVQNDIGGGASQSGWQPKDSTVNLDTPPIVQSPSSSDTREVFVAWTINGQDVNNPQVTINMDKTYSAVAKYQKQFHVDVQSDLGNPTGAGWYNEGSVARVQVEKALPMNGILGALGARQVFDHWSVGGSNNIADITVDAPKSVVAYWGQDYTVPLVIVVLIALGIVGLIFIRNPERKTAVKSQLGHAVRRGRSKSAETEAGSVSGEDPLVILKRRYANGELDRKEYLQRKNDLESEPEKNTKNMDADAG
jgi:hypothetical protein